MARNRTRKALDPKGRVVFGQPLTKAEGRFFDLRESGYTGWINSLGERETDATVDAAFSARQRRARRG